MTQERGLFSASRRRFLLGGTASLIAVGLVGKLSFDSVAGQDAWVEKILRRHFSGVKLDDGSLPLFFRDIRAKGILGARRHRLAVLMDQTLPGPSSLVTRVRHAIEVRERLVLSEFLLGSNFFRVQDPTRETITYFGRPPVCGNPFAVFETRGDSPRTDPDPGRQRATSLATRASGGSRTRSHPQTRTER